MVPVILPALWLTFGLSASTGLELRGSLVAVLLGKLWLCLPLSFEVERSPLELSPQ